MIEVYNVNRLPRIFNNGIYIAYIGHNKIFAKMQIPSSILEELRVISTTLFNDRYVVLSALEMQCTKYDGP